MTEPKPRAFKKATGRPTKLTKAVQERILSFVRVGSYVETAAAAAGVSKFTFYDWLRRGARLEQQIERLKDKGEPMPELTTEDRRLIAFPHALEKAAAESELMDLTTIKQASAQNWQAAAWRLERKSPDKWGRRDTVKQELSGPGGQPVKAEVTTIPGGAERVAHAYKEKLRRELLAEMKGQAST